MEQASAKNDVLGAALAAVEAYRNLEGAADVARSEVPREVPMMDYAAFKLSLLTMTPAVDWDVIAATTREADGNWAALAKRVHDTGLRNLGNTFMKASRVRSIARTLTV